MLLPREGTHRLSGRAGRPATAAAGCRAGARQRLPVGGGFPSQASDWPMPILGRVMTDFLLSPLECLELSDSPEVSVSLEGSGMKEKF